MQTSAEAVYSASSPPFILDSEMSGRLDSDADFEFLNTNLSNEAANSPGVFYAEDFATENSQFVNFNSPAPSSFKSPIPAKASFLDKKAQPVSAPSTVSPAGSESSGYKRKSSSESSRSGITAGDMMMDDSEMGDWKMDDAMGGMTGFNDASTFETYDGTINPASMNTSFGDFNDKSMNDDFDFESAASSPSMFGNTNGPMDMESPEMPTIRHDTPRKHSPAMKSKINRNHNKANSQHSVIQSMNGLTTSASREASPLSAMMTSHESSPAALFSNTPSPVTGTEYVSGTMFGSAPQNQGWAGSFQSHGLPTVQQAANHPPPPPQTQPQAQPVPRMAPAQASQPKGPYDPVLSIHPTPLKSRVETQIPIKMTLYPFPQGITKLHLPTHTISKPKLLAKPTLERAPDTLELYTTLVCTSAMQSPENRQRAFERAAAPPSKVKAEEKSEGDEEEEKEEDKPLNGGDVNICPGCITRERKRAARKKVKKVEEEESWHKDEAKRVIVFNTHELKDWQDPSHQASPDGSPEPYIPPGAMQVDAPMRIACYCRHQQEKLGFQVILTIKDYQDRVIAQAMTNSIMITDDHKTHNMPTLSTQNSSGSDGPLYPGPPFPTDGTFELGPGPIGNMGSFRMSHSTSDLQSMAGNFNLQFPHTLGMTTSSHPSQTTSATMTPRNMSRQTSPSAALGPTSKKRKASGSGKVPTGLAMTRLETGQLSGPGQMSSNPMSAAPSTAASPFTPSLASFPMPDMQFGQPPSNVPPIPQQYNTGPPTPNSNDQLFLGNNHRSLSMENLAMAHPLFSAPTSAHPSRAPSPNSLRNGGPSYHNQQQNQMPQGANGVFNMPMSITSPRPPTIHKLIPNEGPRAGGIEVTCLGSGFSQGLEVMFGESKATTTTFWGETSLVCLLPPSAFAGTVPVTFRHQQQQMQPFVQNLPKSQAFFKYVDDDEQQLIRTALAVLGHKMTGKMEDVRDLARRIVGDGNPSWGGSASHSPPGGPGNQQMSGFNAATFGVDLEATLLRCLDLIDLDDSPHMPRLNLRRSSGQTMLHLACSLGLNRVVAALLARGANPEARDKGGFTPMHFAALHNHPQIVRRLMLGGADPTIRSLQGFTPSDMATTEEVLRVARRIEHHSRTRSGSSLKSRTSSATSLRSVWQPLSRPASNDQALSEDSDDGDNEYEDEDADAANDGAFWMRSVRRPSVQQMKQDVVAVKDPVLVLPGQAGLASPTAAMTAFRDQVTAQIQALQQTMHLNFPNLPQMPALPDYQNYLGPNAPMVRRISNLVNSRQEPVPGAKDQDYRWWDLFSGTVPSAPPAYEDIFPQGDADTKRETASRAAADAVADNKCVELFDQVEGQAQSSTAMQKRPVVLGTLRIGNQHTITREQQDQLRLAHAEKVKRLSRDRNLFFIWIPLLTVVILAMLYNRVPQALNYVSKVVDSMQARADKARFVEVQ